MLSSGLRQMTHGLLYFWSANLNETSFCHCAFQCKCPVCSFVCSRAFEWWLISSSFVKKDPGQTCTSLLCTQPVHHLLVSLTIGSPEKTTENFYRGWKIAGKRLGAGSYMWGRLVMFALGLLCLCCRVTCLLLASQSAESSGFEKEAY